MLDLSVLGVSDELCKRVSVQRRDAPFKDDRECLHRLTPMLDRHRPFFAILRKAKYNNLKAASSLGNEALVLMTFRKLMFKDSMALVV
jgi:hypothetical protein